MSHQHGGADAFLLKYEGLGHRLGTLHDTRVLALSAPGGIN